LKPLHIIIMPINNNIKEKNVLKESPTWTNENVAGSV
jgi:hypothetical protein